MANIHTLKVEIDRATAKSQGKNRYFTGVPCTRGHISDRRVSTKECIACRVMRNRGEIPTVSVKPSSSPEIKKCLGSARWALHRARRMSAVPPWFTESHLDQIKDIYREAKRLDLTVDHIVPLRGKNVRGLHVPWNLQIISAAENHKKYNLLAESV